MLQVLDEFKEVIITGILSFLSAIVAFFAGKRKQVAETRQAEADVVRSIQDLYGGLVENIKLTAEESKHIREELAETRKNMGALYEEVSILRNHIRMLEKELDDCRNSIKA